MKRIVASNNIYYLFKSSSKNSKRRYYEDIFVPKLFVNLYNLSKKRKVPKLENKKYEDKDYLLNINSYFKQEQINDIKTISNIDNRSVPNKNIRINKRFFSANPKGLSQVRYTVNDILLGTYKNKKSKNIENSTNIKGINTYNNENKQKKTLKFSLKKEKESKKETENNNKIKNTHKLYINGYNIFKNNSPNNNKNENEKNNELTINNSLKSRNINFLKNELNKNKNLNIETTSLKNNSIFNGRRFNFRINNNKNKYYKFNKSISKTNTKLSIFKASLKKERDLTNENENSNTKIPKNSIQNLKKSFPLKIKNSYLMDNYCIFTKKKIAPKLKQMTKVNNFIIEYKTKEELNQLFSEEKIDYKLINNNILSDNEIFYFYINQKYRYQLTKYMKHRINWQYYDMNLKNETINFEWKYYSNKVNFKNFKYEQNTPIKKLKIINLFEKNYEIGNKKNMFINLISYCNEIGYNIFDVVPFTLIISNSKDLQLSFKALKDLMDFIPKEKNIQTNIITNRKYNEHFWYDKNYDYINNQFINFNKNFISDKNLWIIKPPDLYQGKCIEISNNYDEIEKKCKKLFKGVDKTIIAEFEYDDDSFEDDEDNIYSKKPTKFYCCNDIIIQKYLDNPLLYQKRKFDIRCFVLIDSNLNVYFCKEGHLKGCSEFYDLEKTNKYIHITNYSFQKNSFNFEKFEIGNEISYSDFKKFMQKEGISLQKFDDMINQMKFLIKLSFKSVRNKLIKISPVLCFEIFGYDFIIDNDFKPWILEINDNPGLCISSPIIEKLIPRMLDDAFRLTIDKVFNTKYSVDCFDSNGKYRSKFRLDGFNNEENIFEFLCNLN